jgi:hypothetical protein
MMTHRRGWLAGAGAAMMVAGAARPDALRAAQATEARLYDYLFLDFSAPPGVPAARGYLEQVKARKAAIAAAGGEVLGLFTPQLGWHARQAALLVSWNPGAAEADSLMTSLAGLEGVANARRDRLTPTARPNAGDKPLAGGIYVHRWFVIETPALDEFVSLSTQGWRDFEVKFETRIFGLLTAAPTPEEKAAGLTRLLLLTRYADHGVWETSRDPTTDAMAAFLRRQKLTRDTWAASTLLTTL